MKKLILSALSLISVAISAQHLQNYPLAQTPAIGAKKMIWIAAEFGGEKLPDDIIPRMEGATKTFNEYVSVVSRDLLTITSTYSPVYQISEADSNAATDLGSKKEMMRKYAKDDNFDIDGSYIIYVLIAPDLKSFGGLGSGNGSTGEATMGPNFWIPGTVHEMFHMFSLGHAEIIEGGTEVFPGVNKGGGDPFFFMGSEGELKKCNSSTDCSIFATLSLPQKGRAGWIKDGEVDVLENTGETSTFRIYNHDNSTRTTDQKIGAFLTEYDSQGTFCVSYVKNIEGSPRVARNGVLIHYVPYVSPAVSRLLDLTPNSITSNPERPDDEGYNNMYDMGDGAAIEGDKYDVGELFTIEIIKETKVADGDYYTDIKITPIGCPVSTSFNLEEFDYDTLTGTNCEPEAAESWNAESNEISNITLQNSSLTYETLSANGKSIQISSPAGSEETVKIQRRLKNQFISGQTMWLSYLFRADKLEDGHFFVSPSENSEGAIGKSWGNQFSINNSASVRSGANEGDTHLLVAKYVLKDGEKDDIFLWVKPDTAVEPNESNAVAERIGEVDFPGGIGGITIDYNFNDNGTYTVDRISTSNSYTNLFNEDIEDVLSVNDISSADGNFKVYPSPAKEQIFVENSLSRGNNTIELYDTTGRLIRSLESSATKTKLNLNNLSNGLYFIKVKQDNSSSKTFKFVKI